MSSSESVMDTGAYCREIETYLCRRNRGHLIRIVGPAFDQVCGWAEAGVPLPVVVQGIDRKLARYHADGRKRRPLRIEFCEADILEVFDEWRRAVGVTRPSGGPTPSGDPPDHAGEVNRSSRSRTSLPKHIDRVLEQATNRLAHRETAPGVHAALELVIADLDALRTSARGARGSARAAVVDRLIAIDQALLTSVKAGGAAALQDIDGEARAELAPFKARLDEESYARAVSACTDRLVRERFRLPAVRFDG